MRSSVPAVVLGAGINGLGVARSLARADVPVWLLDSDSSRSELHTRTARPLHVPTLRGPELIGALVALNSTVFRGARPVLLLTQEESVKSVSQYRENLIPYYRFTLPPAEVVDTLTHKEGFQRVAEKHSAPVPAMVHVRSIQDLPAIKSLHYPVVIKPGERNLDYGRLFKKAYRIERIEDAQALIERILPVMPDIVVQEWIEGPDSNLYFCLLYMGSQDSPVAAFTGRKLRSWPPQVGGTASCAPAPEVHAKLVEMSAWFFRTAGVSGLASMEYKRDSLNDRFCMVEPTIGRTDFQEEVATLNGVNLPAAAYCAELGLPFKITQAVKRPVIWRVLEDARSAASQKQSRNSVYPPGAAVVDGLWRWQDPVPFLWALMHRFRHRILQWPGKVIKHSKPAREKS